jgi:hypothetical protein
MIYTTCKGNGNGIQRLQCQSRDNLFYVLLSRAMRCHQELQWQQQHNVNNNDDNNNNNNNNKRSGVCLSV